MRDLLKLRGKGVISSHGVRDISLRDLFKKVRTEFNSSDCSMLLQE